MHCACMCRYTRYNSGTLNSGSSSSLNGTHAWSSDGLSALSPGERALVDAVVQAWQQRGPGCIIAVDAALEEAIVRAG
jgi:hypothetical protein